MLSSPRDQKALALTTGYCLLLYWQAVSGRGYFFERDIWLYWLPHIEWATRSLASGHLPQWNPFKGFGAPFMADPNFEAGKPEPRIAEVPAPASAAWIETEEADRWIVHTHLSVPGTLVVLIGASDGWQARVDGKPAPILPANLIFQSVDLQTGEHVVEFEYQTSGLLPDLGLTGIACAVLAIASAKRRPASERT